MEGLGRWSRGKVLAANKRTTCWILIGELGTAAHTCNPRARDVEANECRVVTWSIPHSY